MLGMMDGRGEADDPDPINRESATVQCVVARAAGSDLLNVPGGSAAIVSFLGMVISTGPASLDQRPSSTGLFGMLRPSTM